jgi:hypothetical protein
LSKSFHVREVESAFNHALRYLYFQLILGVQKAISALSRALCLLKFFPRLLWRPLFYTDFLELTLLRFFQESKSLWDSNIRRLALLAADCLKSRISQVICDRFHSLKLVIHKLFMWFFFVIFLQNWLLNDPMGVDFGLKIFRRWVGSC